MTRNPAAKSGQSAPTMRVLTIWEPWASLIALGVKRVENRGWSTAYRGPLLIHAGKRWKRAEVEETLAELVELGMLTEQQVPSLVSLQANLGKVIARTEIVGCRAVGVDDPDPWAMAGGFALELGEVIRLVPFDLKGMQGMFSLDPRMSSKIVPRDAGHPFVSSPPVPDRR